MVVKIVQGVSCDFQMEIRIERRRYLEEGTAKQDLVRTWLIDLTNFTYGMGTSFQVDILDESLPVSGVITKSMERWGELISLVLSKQTRAGYVENSGNLSSKEIRASIEAPSG